MSMGKSFIEEVSSRVMAAQNGRLHLVTIVVPAKRSLRFFRNAITRVLANEGKAAIMPEIVTLNDLTTRFSPYTVLTPLELAFHFYKVYCELEQQPEPFEKFYTWAPALLSDFNEVDNYLVNPDNLFRDLKNIKEIDEWSFLSSDWSQGQQKLNAFWEKIPLYYKKLNEYLVQHRLAYSGMANRFIAENAPQIFIQAPKRHYVFAGFNALTACEKTIMQHLNQVYGAELYFDADHYYVEHEFHEAGLFIRSFENVFEKHVNVINAGTLLHAPKKIEYYECNGEALQCAQLVKLIENKTPEELSRAAIVLCNEQLLPVLIGEFPSEFLRINVTMGWPLRFTSLNDFFQAIIDVHISLQRNKTYVPYEQVKHFSDIASAVFPLAKGAVLHEVTTYQHLLDLYEGKNIGTLLQHPGDDIMLFVKKAVVFLQEERLTLGDEDLQAEILSHFIEVFNKMQQLPGFSEHIKSWYLFRRFFQAFVRQYPLAFLGEPMWGMQVMGMLETRGLDFDQVYVLSCNEGFLPAQHTSPGFIPYELREFVKLPGKAEQDAVFAYYFYRLIQRAGEVHLFYNGQNELLQQAEKSRYLVQIEKELAELNTQIDLQCSFVNQRLPSLQQHQYPVKTTYYFEKLDTYAKTGMSASMLSTWVNCPLDFYFKYILGFKEDRDPQLIEESDVGNIIHEFFHIIFSPLLEKVLEESHLQNALHRIEGVVRDIVREKYNKYDFSSGENYLALQMVRKMIASFLQRQMNPGLLHRIVGKILVGSEIKLETDMELEGGRTIRLKGTVDLLMSDSNGNYFIYDFKTGRAQEEDLTLPVKADVVEVVQKKNKLLQLMVYQQLVRNVYPQAVSIEAALIPLAAGAGKFLPAPQTGQALLEQALTGIVEEMYNTDMPLEHEVKSKFCEFCY